MVGGQKKRERKPVSDAITIKEHSSLAITIPSREFCTADHTLISSSKGLERASVEAEDCEAKCVASSANLGEGREEVPERRAVHDGVIDGASDEDSVAELRHLHSGQGEELFEPMGNINRA
ncbi:hypothetical protein CsSME_00038106 [Camellia sinensis var. sinensis]